MIKRGVSFIILVLLNISCVDRIDFNTSLSEYPVVVEGYISDQPGPYEIRVTRSFDIQSKSSIRQSISAKKITLFDDTGKSEILEEFKQGFYRTSPGGIQGEVGRSYKILVELLDGKVYESIPDKMLNSGSVDSVYFSFVTEDYPSAPTQYAFDVFFDTNIETELNADFLWRFVGTYQIDTNPEAATEPCGESRCAKPRPCSGWVNGNTGLTQVGSCECCVCWVDFYNDVPIVSDNEIIINGKYRNVKAYRVPLTQWIFMHKVYARIEQLSLTPRAKSFWKAIKDQKEAAGSLFQPISGRVPNNYNQISGEPEPLEGFFFATSIKNNGVFITRDDVPDQRVIPPRDLPYNESCLTFPNSTNQKPSFWE